MLQRRRIGALLVYLFLSFVNSHRGGLSDGSVRLVVCLEHWAADDYVLIAAQRGKQGETVISLP